ncbi:CDP-glycerol glycerophosphotransferase family protein [bacterium]|nr:CDP-glycerol glycerophosphotransferase family protein [bacterium]
MLRAIVHLHRASHLPHAIPLLHVLRQAKNWQLVVTRTAYNMADKVGLPPLYEERLHRLGLRVMPLDEAGPADVCFTFEPVRELAGCADKIVQLPASLIGKGLRYGGGSSVARDNLADLQIVPGRWHAERLRRSGGIFVPVITAGLPALDPILGGWVAPREMLRQQLRIEPQQKAILYAPTWNPELSSAPLLWTRVRTLATPERVLILRPHPYLPDEYQQACAELEKGDANIRVAREPDLQPYLHVADAVVSDLSSVAWEAAVLDKPVIRFDTPNHREYTRFDDTDPEYKLANIGPLVRTLDELREAVDQELAEPQQGADLRRTVRDQLLADTQGTTCARILQAAGELVQRDASSAATGRTTVNVLVDARGASLNAVDGTIEAVLDRGREPATVHLLGVANFAPDIISGWQGRWPGRVRTDQLPKQLAADPTSHLLLLKAGTVGTHGWLFRLVNHLRRHAGLDAVAPLAVGGRPVQEPEVRIQQGDGIDPAYESLDARLQFHQAGELLEPTQAPAPDAILLRAGSPLTTALLPRWRKRDWPDTSEKIPVGIAPDVVLEFTGRRINANRMTSALHDDERARAEERVRELSQWIQRGMPPRIRNVKAESHEPAAVSLDPATLSGPLRLAHHYIEQGKLDRAGELLERALHESPGDPAAIQLARQAGISVNGYVSAAGGKS